MTFFRSRFSAVRSDRLTRALGAAAWRAQLGQAFGIELTADEVAALGLKRTLRQVGAFLSPFDGMPRQTHGQHHVFPNRERPEAKRKCSPLARHYETAW